MKIASTISTTLYIWLLAIIFNFSVISSCFASDSHSYVSDVECEYFAICNISEQNVTLRKPSANDPNLDPNAFTTIQFIGSYDSNKVTFTNPGPMLSKQKSIVEISGVSSQLTLDAVEDEEINSNIKLSPEIHIKSDLKFVMQNANILKNLINTTTAETWEEKYHPIKFIFDTSNTLTVDDKLEYAHFTPQGGNKVSIQMVQDNINSNKRDYHWAIYKSGVATGNNAKVSITRYNIKSLNINLQDDIDLTLVLDTVTLNTLSVLTSDDNGNIQPSFGGPDINLNLSNVVTINNISNNIDKLNLIDKARANLTFKNDSIPYSIKIVNLSGDTLQIHSHKLTLEKVGTGNDGNGRLNIYLDDLKDTTQDNTLDINNITANTAFTLYNGRNKSIINLQAIDNTLGIQVKMEAVSIYPAEFTMYLNNDTFDVIAINSNVKDSLIEAATLKELTWSYYDSSSTPSFADLTLKQIKITKQLKFGANDRGSLVKHIILDDAITFKPPIGTSKENFTLSGDFLTINTSLQAQDFDVFDIRLSVLSSAVTGGDTKGSIKADGDDAARFKLGFHYINLDELSVQNTNDIFIRSERSDGITSMVCQKIECGNSIINIVNVDSINVLNFELLSSLELNQLQVHNSTSMQLDIYLNPITGVNTDLTINDSFAIEEFDTIDIDIKISLANKNSSDYANFDMIVLKYDQLSSNDLQKIHINAPSEYIVDSKYVDPAGNLHVLLTHSYTNEEKVIEYYGPMLEVIENIALSPDFNRVDEAYDIKRVYDNIDSPSRMAEELEAIAPISNTFILETHKNLHRDFLSNVQYNVAGHKLFLSSDINYSTWGALDVISSDVFDSSSVYKGATYDSIALHMGGDIIFNNKNIIGLALGISNNLKIQGSKSLYSSSGDYSDYAIYSHLQKNEYALDVAVGVSNLTLETDYNNLTDRYSRYSEGYKSQDRLTYISSIISYNYMYNMSNFIFFTGLDLQNVSTNRKLQYLPRSDIQINIQNESYYDLGLKFGASYSLLTGVMGVIVLPKINFTIESIGINNLNGTTGFFMADIKKEKFTLKKLDYTKYMINIDANLNIIYQLNFECNLKIAYNYNTDIKNIIYGVELRYVL